MKEERLAILRMLEAGEIDAEQAATLLAATETQEDESQQGQDVEGYPGEQPGSAWSRFWIYPLIAGGSVLFAGAVIMGLVNATNAARGWLMCAWLPMLLGLVVLLLAWWTRKAKWLHLRIREGDRQTMALSFPLPLTLAAWVLKVAQPFVPELKKTGIDDLIIALRDGVTGDEPIYIDVQDDSDGERVQLYIG
jgi:hypothetical protein